jgi:7 transmembrane helices usually fused to an inactive transglutaminase/Transglutaminase-like superfamily/Inactive transglutaminase fused to 7 transmembrane helices
MRNWTVVSAGLIGAGIVVFLYKVLVLGYPLSTAEETGTWRVQFVLNVTGQGGRAVVEIPLPRTSSYQRLLTEEVRSGALRFSISERDEGRRGRWSGKLDGTTTVSYEVTFDTLAYARPLPETDATKQYSKSISDYLQDSPGVQASDPAVGELSRELLLDKADKAKLAREIYRFVAREIGSLQSTAPMDAVAVIREGRGNTLGRARLFCALARANKLPCRVLVGVSLENGRQDQFEYWNEAYVGGGWVPFDTVQRRMDSLPPNRLALASNSDGTPAVSTGTSALAYRFYVQSELETYAELVRRRLAASQNALDRISLLFLPVQLQHTLRILLLVPLGALAMCILRNIIGIQTFGMFMPMLIALALTGTGLAWGTAFLAMIIGAALLSRLWIERLYLLLAARIAFILTLVIILMIALFLLGDRMNLPISGVGAFPFVIMTMIVERISVSLDEEGPGNTLRRIASTLLAIYVTYAVIHARLLQTIFLVFPEALIVIMGLLVAVGRYTGYRLTELVRFRELGLSAPPPPPPSEPR